MRQIFLLGLTLLLAGCSHAPPPAPSVVPAAAAPQSADAPAPVVLTRPADPALPMETAQAQREQAEINKEQDYARRQQQDAADYRARQAQARDVSAASRPPYWSRQAQPVPVPSAPSRSEQENDMAAQQALRQDQRGFDRSRVTIHTQDDTDVTVTTTSP